MPVVVDDPPSEEDKAQNLRTFLRVSIKYALLGGAFAKNRQTHTKPEPKLDFFAKAGERK